jgi:Omp85 superfamily domain
MSMRRTLLRIVWKTPALALTLIVAACECVQGNQYAGSLFVQEVGAIKQTPNPTPSQTDLAKGNSPAPATQQEDNQSKPEKEKRGTFIVAPIPISSPAVGAGLVLGLGYVFKLDMEDKVSPPSMLGVAGAFTNNGTRGGGFGGKLYFKENKYQTTFMLAKGRVNYEFFGVGRLPGKPAVSVPLQSGGTVFFGEFMRNVGKDIFVGGRYQFRKLYARLNGVRPPGGFEVPEIDLRANTAAIGVHVQRDRRDNGFYPTKGSLFDAAADFFDQGWGSKREYQYYKVSFNGYREVAKGQVVAYRLMGCSANGSVPFYDLCLYGGSDLRGYTSGEFQNRRMFATQAEYRRELPKRLGVVAFGGVGGVARQWNDFRSDGLLPAAGLGLRFKLDKKHHINYRIDYAVGRGGHTLSIGVGEAF